MEKDFEYNTGDHANIDTLYLQFNYKLSRKHNETFYADILIWYDRYSCLLGLQDITEKITNTHFYKKTQMDVWNSPSCYGYHTPHVIKSIYKFSYHQV